MRYFNPDEGYASANNSSNPTTFQMRPQVVNMNNTTGSGTKTTNFVFSRNYSNTGNYKNISLNSNNGFSQGSNIPPEYDPPVKRMFTNPSKGFKLDSVNVADYYCNNPKYVDFIGAMPPPIQPANQNVKINVQPPSQPMSARSVRQRNGNYMMSENYSNNHNNSARRGYTSTPRQPPPTKLWTQPKERLPPVITMPLNSLHQQHRSYNHEKPA